jgi:putative Holliday junction resolvase
MRFLGVDFGLRRIGVAVSDEGGRMARPLEVLRAPEGRLPYARLEALVREYAPAAVVVGDPRRLDGSPGTLARAAKEFAGRLGKRSGVRVLMRDESLTTCEAEEKLREAGANRRKRRSLIDAAAAAVMLQDYLDSLAGKR